MGRAILTINSGSSSCKVALFLVDNPQRTLELHSAETLSGTNQSDVLLDWCRKLPSELEIIGVGHRFVHGGPVFTAPAVVNGDIIAQLETLVQYDSLHGAPALDIIKSCVGMFNGCAQVVSFDTSFYANLPPLARMIALPEYIRAKGVRRYGFHGLSYSYVQREFENRAGLVARNGRVLYAHLGSGSSLTATKHGEVVDTTMGFSPASGIPTNSRTGDVDPTLASFVQQSLGISADEFATIAQTESGLKAVSESSGDMKHLLDVEDSDPKAALAVALYVYRVQMAIGSLVAAMGGIDSLVFTGGIGEQSSILRSRIVSSLDYLGISVNQARNREHAFTISEPGGGVGVHVINTDESIILAENVRNTIIEQTEGTL